jgi:hypothetical protein
MGHDVIGMEQYVAEETTPLDRSLADVRSSDVYLVVVGWRYGYVPKDLKANPNRRSITELEYEAAAAVPIPILAFLLDPDAPWPPSSFDALTETGGAEILRFRSLLGAVHLAGIFRTPDNLASQAAAAVARQGITRQMADRALTQDQVGDSMAAFARGQTGTDDPSAVGSIRAMVTDVGARTTRALLIEMGLGDQWWSTRLYLLAALTQTLTGVRQFVFAHEGRFMGMASPAAVRDGLCAAFHELAEFDTALRGDASRDVEREINRCLDLWRERMRPDEPNLKVGVRWQLLAEWLGERVVSRCIRIGPETGLTMVQVQQLVDSLLPDVPVERRYLRPASPDQPSGPVETELMVVDRDAFALELARQWVRTGLPRTPVP